LINKILFFIVAIFFLRSLRSDVKCNIFKWSLCYWAMLLLSTICILIPLNRIYKQVLVCSIKDCWKARLLIESHKARSLFFFFFFKQDSHKNMGGASPFCIFGIETLPDLTLHHSIWTSTSIQTNLALPIQCQL